MRRLLCHRMLEYHVKASGKRVPVLVACPCGYEFRSGSRVAEDGTRFGSDRARHLYEDHDAGDF